MPLIDKIRTAQRDAGEKVVIENLRRLSTPAGGREEKLDDTLEAQLARLLVAVERNEKLLAQVVSTFSEINEQLTRCIDGFHRRTNGAPSGRCGSDSESS